MRKRYAVYVTSSERGYLEIEAESEEEAKEIAADKLDDVEPYGESEIEFEAEEINDD